MALPEDRPLVSSRQDVRRADTGELLMPGSNLHSRGKPVRGSNGDLLQVLCQRSLVARIYRMDEGVLWVELPESNDAEGRRDARDRGEDYAAPTSGLRWAGLPLIDEVPVSINCKCGYQHKLDPLHLIELVDRLGQARDRKLRRVDVDTIRRASH